MASPIAFKKQRGYLQLFILKTVVTRFRLHDSEQAEGFGWADPGDDLLEVIADALPDGHRAHAKQLFWIADDHKASVANSPVLLAFSVSIEELSEWWFRPNAVHLKVFDLKLPGHRLSVEVGHDWQGVGTRRTDPHCGLS